MSDPIRQVTSFQNLRHMETVANRLIDVAKEAARADLEELRAAVMRYLNEGDEHGGKMPAFPMECKGARCSMWRLAR